MTAYRCRTLAIVLIALLGVGLSLARAVAAEAPPVIHEARILYHLDRSSVPAWVRHRQVTLRVEVGPALDCVATGDGVAASCSYDGQIALISTDAEWVELVISGPGRELEAIGAATVATLYDDKDWALSLTLDDGYTSQATTGHVFLGRYGYDATIAVVGSYIGRTVSGKSYASAEQLQAVVADGWELSNHSNMHQKAAAMGTSLDVMRDLRAANVAIAAAVPSYVPYMFTNPFADTDFDAIVEHYTDELGFHLYQTTRWSGRQVDPGAFSFDDLIPYAIGRNAIAADGSQFDEAHGWVTGQPGTHWWLSLHTHYVQPACDCVETASDYLYRTFGAGGSDEVWVAPAPQVFDYLVARDRTIVTETSRAMLGDPPAGYALDQTPADQPPVVRTLVLGQPTQDATIHSYKPTYRYGGESGLAVRTVNQASALLQFDLSTLDPRAHVTAAVLRLYGLQGTNPDAETCVQAHRLLTPWDEATTTWREASAGTAWAAYGAAGLGLDRAGELTGLRVLSNGLPGWYALDVTDDVRLLQGAPEANHGWLIAGSGDAAKEVVFASREHPSAAWRPRLEISYTLPQTPEPGPPGPAGLALRLAGWSGVFGVAEPPRVVTVTLDAAASYSYVLTRSVSAEGRVTVDGVAAGRYDVRIELAGALPLIRQNVVASVGGAEVALGPLVMGDVSGDHLVGARDWQLVSAALDGGILAAAGGIGAQTDLNGDGLTAVADAALLMASYGRFGDVLSSGVADQPEPTPQAVGVVVRPNPAFVAQQADGSAQVVVDTAGQPVWGLDLVLRFDPLVLRLDDVSELLTGHRPVSLAGNTLAGEDGSLRYRIVLQEPISGTIPVLDLSYQAITQEATTTAWLIDAESQVVVVGQNLLAYRSDGHIGIRAANVLSLPQVFGRLSGLASAATDASALDGSVVQQAGAMSYPGAVRLPIVANVPVTQPVFEARDVRLDGGHAYLLQAPFFYERTHVRVLDVSDPLHPALLTAVRSTDRSVNDPDELWVEGARIVVANKCNGVDILDASDPANTRQVGNFEWAYPPEVNVKGVHAVGDRLFVADERGLQIVDMSTPSRPSLLGVLNFEGAALGAFGEGVWAEGDTVYVAASYYTVIVDKIAERRPHVLIVDVTDPSHPRAVARAVGPWLGRAVDVEVFGDTLYVAAENGGLLTFDVSDPREPVYLDGVATHLAQKVAVVANLVYVADDTGGLVVVDASDPADLVVVGVCDTPGRAFGVDASEGYAYVADGTGGMQVISLAGLTVTATPSVTPTLTPTATPGPGPLLFPLILRGAAAR